MGDPITTAIVSTVVSKVGGKILGGGSDNSGKAAAAETARLNAQAETDKVAAEAERKKKASQRTATGVIFGGGASDQSTGIGNLGG